jgi:hypothetical protein
MAQGIVDQIAQQDLQRRSVAPRDRCLRCDLGLQAEVDIALHPRPAQRGDAVLREFLKVYLAAQQLLLPLGVSPRSPRAGQRWHFMPKGPGSDRGQTLRHGPSCRRLKRRQPVRTCVGRKRNRLQGYRTSPITKKAYSNQKSFISQLQSPTLAFLLGGILIAALGSRLTIPDSIYKFIVFMLLMKVGLKGGMAIGEADLAAMLLPALIAVFVGCLIVVIGRYTLAMLPGIRTEDGIATAGLFGAVSGSTLAAGMVVLENDGIAYEPWAAALYPFMDIPALVLAIVLASLYLKRKDGSGEKVQIWPIVKESLQGSALSALLLGIALGLFTNPTRSSIPSTSRCSVVCCRC